MASTIKVDNVQNQPGTNIINKCGTTITLGASSDTVALAAGATQTGFGRTGTVDWDTSIKTGTVTAATGSGYFVDTTSGGITVNLPVAAVGSIVAVSDYASTAASNNITITPNGSEKINGVNDNFYISTAGLAVTLVYADATRGWKSVTGSDADATGLAPAFVAATGGTPCAGATCGDYKIHTFTGPGTLCVSCAGNPAGNDVVEYIVVAGGGSGGAGDGTHGGGGGGAGGFRFASPSLAPLCYPAKPLSAPANLTVTATGIPITVGAGAPGGSGCTVNRGSDSTFSTITSTGGGSGANDNLTTPGALALPGGSGGGSGVDSGAPTPRAAGTGNTPTVSPPQGQPGGTGVTNSYGGAGGGGGTIVTGSNAPPSPVSQGGAGGAGAGLPTAFGSNGQPCGSFRYYGGGGGGGSHQAQVCASAPGGVGGGGASSPSAGVAGTVNTGGGGGSTPTAAPGATGGSGIVIIRYKFQ